ncbi:MAG: hypothetical protein AAF125_13930, partial [Chloroflexota bacterium]
MSVKQKRREVRQPVWVWYVLVGLVLSFLSLVVTLSYVGGQVVFDDTCLNISIPDLHRDFVYRIADQARCGDMSDLYYDTSSCPGRRLSGCVEAFVAKEWKALRAVSDPVYDFELEVVYEHMETGELAILCVAIFAFPSAPPRVYDVDDCDDRTPENLVYEFPPVNWTTPFTAFFLLHVHLYRHHRQRLVASGSGGTSYTRFSGVRSS